MAFRTPMCRRLVVRCLLVAMLVAATGCTVLKDGNEVREDLGTDGGAVDAGHDGGAPFDGGTVDLGAIDSGEIDEGVPDLGVDDDAGEPDLGYPDLGESDLGPPDVGPPDLGLFDLGPSDMGPSDPGLFDLGPDLGESDLGPADMGPSDLGPPDMGPSDPGLFDLGPSPDMGPRCGPASPTGDTRWPQYPLPGTPGHTRSYQVLGTASNQTVIDCVTGLEWQRTVDAASYTQANAIAYCVGLTLAGYTDWRLPSTIELMTLVDYTVASPGPTIDATAFPTTPTQYFWSSSSVAGSSSVGWGVGFNIGYAYRIVATDAGRARCVRGNATVRTDMGAPPGHFTVGTGAADGTVRDNLTGLVWQQGFSPWTQSQGESITYCSTLAIPSGGGWRLPTVLELRSIVDESVVSSTIDATAFPTTPFEAFWSSSSVAGSLSGGWYVYFGSGAANNVPATIAYRARCVR